MTASREPRCEPRWRLDCSKGSGRSPMASERTALECLDREGFTEHFAVDGASLRGLDGGKTFRPDEVLIRKLARFEGVSDPDDMSIVYAIESRDGTRGTLIEIGRA